MAQESTTLSDKDTSKSTIQPAAGRESSRLPRWSPSTIVTILATSLLAIGPIVGQGLPLEISQWHVAAAVDRELAGDIEGAVASLDRAIQWSGTNPAVYLARAELNMRQENYSAALKDFDQSLRFSPNSLFVITRRTEALQYLGRFDEAVEDWERLVARYESMSSDARAMLLNGLAYARALAADSRPPAQRSMAHLDKALDEVERAILLDRGSTPNHLNSAMLDTRGFILLLRNELKQAETDLNRAVDGATAELSAVRAVKDYADEHARAHDIQIYERALAVMLYHRSKLWNELGISDKSQADLERIAELGFTPGPRLF